MAVKVVLFAAFALQLIAALIALLLNRRYRERSAWTLISATAIVMAVRPLASLLLIWNESPQELAQNLLWAESLATLLIAVLFLSGVAMIDPLFKDLAKAEEVLRKEKHELEESVAATEEEMAVAKAIQRALLPSEPPQLAGVQIAGSSEPAEWTSGDYFDYFALPDGSLLTLVGDVSGHGTGPALLMTETRAYVRAFAQSHCDVGQVLTLTNRALANDVAYGQFVTMFAARIPPDANTLQYASAGQDAHLLRADGTKLVLESTCPPLGVMGGLEIPTSQAVPLQPGDLLLLITDGLNETRNNQKQQWGTDALLKVAQQHRQLPPGGIVEKLFAAARDFRGAKAPEDDNTAVAVKIG